MNPSQKTRTGKLEVHETGELDPRKLRVLVVIASYGEKHLQFLKQIIGTYRSMSFNVDVVVVSEAEKAIGTDVEVVVGLPSRNPWTLPFAHKAVFAERVERYDLFIYTEDDIGVTEAGIQAFLNITPELEADEIAGYIRYEMAPSGRMFVNDPWGHYHWKPESVRRRGPYLVAEITNEHAGFYILTRWQLKRAIASGGFLRGPCRGRYSWPETAATDPYTNCGFRKVVCISSVKDFLVHHLPNPYVSLLDLSFEAFNEQVQTLIAIGEGEHPASTMFEVESLLMPSFWQKSYYEKQGEVFFQSIPREAETVLSIGCGWGATESELQRRGAKVTAIPLDSVIGAAAERRGINVIYGNWEECFECLGTRKFDCVIATNLLHLQPDPETILGHCARFTREGGTLILTGPNFNRAPWLIKRTLRLGEYKKLTRYETSGFNLVGPGNLSSPLEKAGFCVANVRWLNHSFQRGWLRRSRMALRCLTAKEWLLKARRLPTPSRPASSKRTGASASPRQTESSPA